MSVYSDILERQNAELTALLLKVAKERHFLLERLRDIYESPLPDYVFNTCPDEICTQARAAAQKE